MTLDVLLNGTFLAAVTPYAQEIAGYFTNSILVAGIVALIIVLIVRKATKKVQLVPEGPQNFVEFVVESLYALVEGIVGKKVAPKAFPLLGTLFIFILVSNWIGLVPGIGTIGWDEHHHGPLLSVHHIKTALLRPPTADMNMTIGMALCAFFVFWVITIREVGVMGFLKHTFGPKGGLQGIMKYVLIPIFLFVGAIEMISIFARPLSLSLRLYGNLFAGETLLHTMGGLVKVDSPVVNFLASVALPLPFYFMELLVGFLQAAVFTILCAVYIQLTTAEEEH